MSEWNVRFRQGIRHFKNISTQGMVFGRKKFYSFLLFSIPFYCVFDVVTINVVEDRWKTLAPK